MIKFLHLHFQGKTIEEFRSFFLSYDNMCHVDELKLLSKPLALPAPYDRMWLEIAKVIDPLHLANHTRKKCKELYNPEKVKSTFPEANFMSAEQTFAWQGRYKKIFNSMTKGSRQKKPGHFTVRLTLKVRCFVIFLVGEIFNPSENKHCKY